MDPFSPDYWSERLMRIVRPMACITVIQFLLVWWVGFLTLSWAQVHDNQVPAKVVRYGLSVDGYFGVFDVPGLPDYIRVYLTNKQHDSINASSSEIWVLSRDIEPLWLDTGHPFPMFLEGETYPDWYRVLRPGVEYCKPAIVYLIIQFAFSLLFMISLGVNSSPKTKGFYQAHRELTESFKQPPKKPSAPPDRVVSELYGEIPPLPKPPVPPTYQVSDDSVFGGHR